MKAHLVQYDIAWEDKPANHARVRAMLETVQTAAGDLILLPEMFDTGFSMRTETTAADPEVSTAFLGELARERAAWVIASIPVRLQGAGGPRDCVNRGVVVAPDGMIRLEADKLHPFSYGREAERFVGGEDVKVTTVGERDAAVALCPIICYDLRFPEVFRVGLDKGAEVFTLVANWPAARQAHWRALCIARAIENQAMVIALNRCGSDPKLGYLGGSIVVDAMGGVVAEAGGEEAVVSAPVDVGAVREWRATFPALADRRRWTLG